MTMGDVLTSKGLRVGIHSEVGRLREVIVHSPGSELDRLTPVNAADLLFDDVLWAARAREEQDAFLATSLRALLDDIDPAELAEFFIRGVLTSDVAPHSYPGAELGASGLMTSCWRAACSPPAQPPGSWRSSSPRRARRCTSAPY